MNNPKVDTCVSLSPSKIPYGGFSPVRLQTEIRLPPSLPLPALSAARIRRSSAAYRQPQSWRSAAAIHDVWTRRSETEVASGSSGTSAVCTERFRPEALGSPAGYAVPPGQRLLWPHPSLSVPPADLCIRRRVLSSIGLDRTGTERFPNLLPVSVPTCRLPYPGSVLRLSGLLTQSVAFAAE